MLRFTRRNADAERAREALCIVVAGFAERVERSERETVALRAETAAMRAELAALPGKLEGAASSQKRGPRCAVG